jgi:hypothetical protein
LTLSAFARSRFSRRSGYPTWHLRRITRVKPVGG